MIRQVSEQMKETERKIKETNRQVAALDSRIGEVVESLV